ncbi:MAG TPA: hypothetical protein VMR37_07410, partial [Rhabdochlamydiaceae bacterium]|nr:hypothetical protein [Rhabdochlamydiaceae bacterium]
GGRDHEKARNFIQSALRVSFACGVIWALYKGQHFESLRKINVPVILLAMKAATVSYSIEPISFLTNVYMIATAKSKLAVGAYVLVLGIFQCIAQTLGQGKIKEPSRFSVSLKRVALKFDPFSYLMNFALIKIPEARLGIGLYTVGFGVFQTYVYTTARWNLKESPTDLALKGILHIIFGLGWLGLYERHNRMLEEGDNKKGTLFYKAADRLAPALAWLTGR